MKPDDFPRLPGSENQPVPPGLRGSIVIFATLLLLAFAAYGTVTLNYRFYADDAVLLKGFSDPSAAFHWSQQGVWRWAGNTLMAAALANAPQAYLVFTVALHAFNAFLAWSLLRQLGVQPPAPVLTAGLLAVFPGFHEAVAWISASPNIWSTTFFLLTLRVCLRARSAERSTVGLALAGFALAAAGNLFHDQYALAYFTLPVAAAWLHGNGWKPPVDRRRLSVLLAPAFGSGIYILAYLLTIQPTTTKHPSFNWHCLFSPLAYQYVNFAGFDVWQHSVWRHAFWHRIFSPSGLGLLLLLLIGGGALGWLSRSKACDRTIPTENLTDSSRTAWATLLFGLNSIYVLAGGFSLDSRKRYAFVFLGFLALGHLSHSLPRRRWAIPLAGAFIFTCALTTVALTEARNGLLAVKDQLNTAIAAGQVPAGTYVVEWDAGPSRFGHYLWTDPREDIWNQSLPSGLHPVVRHADEARNLAFYDWSHREWRLVPLETIHHIKPGVIP